MTTLFKVEDKLLVSGLQWHMLDSNVASKKGGLGKQTNPDALLAKKTGALMLCGIMPSMVRGVLTKDAFNSMGKVPLFSKIYSTAEIFSTIPDLNTCSAFVAPLPDAPQYFAMCVVLNSVPVPAAGYDKIVHKDNVASEIEVWRNDFHHDYRMELKLYGVYSGAKHLSFSEMLEKADVIRPMRRLAPDKRIVVPIAVSVMLAVGSAYGYQIFQKNKAIKAAAAKKAKQDPIRLYNAALDLQWPQLQWGSVERLRAVLDQAGKIPADIGGFAIAGDTNCDVLTGTCTVTYKLRDGTYDTFAAALGQRMTITAYGQDGKTIQGLVTLANLPPLRSPGPWFDLPSETALPGIFWNPIQALPASVVTGVFTPNYELFPKINGVSEPNLPKRVRFIPVNISYPLWGNATMPPRTPAFDATVSWKSVLIRPNLTVTAKGEMYAQK